MCSWDDVGIDVKSGETAGQQEGAEKLLEFGVQSRSLLSLCSYNLSISL